MSFATALLTALGSYGRGLQQRRDNQQQQDLYKSDQQYRQSQETRENQTAAQQTQVFQDTEADRKRAQGIDPATGQPFVVPPAVQQAMQRARTFNPGAPQHQLGDLYTILDYQTKTGQPTDSTTAQITSLRQQIGQDATFKRALALRSTLTPAQQFTENHWGQITPYEQQSLDMRGQLTPEQQWYLDHVGAPRPPTSGGTQAATRAGKLASDYYNDYKQAFTAATFVPKGPIAGVAPLDPKTGQPMQSQLTDTQQTMLQSAIVNLDNSTSPMADFNKVKPKLTKMPLVSSLLEKYAKYAQQKREAEKAIESEGSGQGAPSGGSDGTPPFPGT